MRSVHVVLDGYDVYHALVTELSTITTADGPGDVSWPDASALPVPGGSVDAAYRQAATDYVDWYRDLFDEPAGHDAWDESRLEYDFDVATGEGTTETVFTANEYPGGRLDWASFEAAPTASLSDGSSESSTPADAGVTEDDIARHASVRYDPDPGSVSTREGEAAIERPTVSRMPTPVAFPGMPVDRWWEFEDGSVNLFDADIGPGELGKEVLVDFALTYGTDWFSLPLETRIGTTNRVTALAVVDTFGTMEVATPSLAAANEAAGDDASEADPDTSTDSQWKLFTDDLGPNHDEPGLFVPPTLSESFESDPLERVVFARDELANLAWAIEERVLDPYGIRIDMEEYTDPILRISGIEAAADPAEEHVELENPGDEPIAVGDWTLVVERTTDSETKMETFPLGGSETDVIVEPGSTLKVFSGAGADRSDRLYWNWDESESQSLLTDATKVVVRNGREWPVGYRDLRTDPGRGGLPAYRLASDVADYWYPLKPHQTGPDGFTEKDTVFALARLVDADVGSLPTPKGRILREYVPDSSSATITTIHDEELTRAGTEVTRSYQLSRWVDGGTHMWSARRTSTGFGQGTSGLRYDYLEQPDDG